jgi:Fe-S-cluster-containing dehydrogenase component
MDDDRHTLETLGPFSSNHMLSRRQILKLGGISIIGVSALSPLLAQGATKPLIIMEQAQGIVVADPTLCVGCGRCELACTEFNDGKAAPTLSRIKVDRNMNFGPDALLAWREGRGSWGSGLIVQDLCKQCPHPVPCADVCPENAITVAPSTGARVVDAGKCTGCKVCLKACPWEMISFDLDSRKATKCHLCSGKPKCVEACPAESLSYVSWHDLTGEISPRLSTAARPQGDRAGACFECHLPGRLKPASPRLASYQSGFRAKKLSSGRESAFNWIDRLGSVCLPVVALCVVIHGALRAMVKR